MRLTSAEGQKQECFKYYENLVNPLCGKVMLLFYLTQPPYVDTKNSMIVMLRILRLVLVCQVSLGRAHWHQLAITST